MSFSVTELLKYIQKDQQDLGMGELTYLISGENSPEMNSTLYTNRGVILWTSGQIQEAFEDFEKSLENNHLNYLSYYNLHSLYAFGNKNVDALKNLCCALSCLHLLRFKTTNN